MRYSDDEWGRQRKRMDDIDEARRVARNARTDAAIATALANLDKVPVHDLKGHLGEEYSCPKCGNRNAMLGRGAWNTGGRGDLLVCRDCNFACFKKKDERVPW